MEKNKCLILGGGGFIGSYLVEGLLNKNYDIRIFEYKGFDRINILHLTDKIEIIEGDFSNIEDLKIAILDVNFIYHLISTTNPITSMNNILYDINSNLLSTINLLDLCVDNKNIKEFIFLSSGGTVYGIPDTIPIKESHPTNPICSYGIVKNAIEKYCMLYKRKYNLNCKIFRLSNPYGERQNPYNNQGAISIFLNKAMLNNKIVIWGDGNIIRDYIYVKDCIDILVAAIEINTNETIYNIGSGIGTSINQILEIIKKIVNIELNIEYKNSRDFDVPTNILDINLLKNDFKWEPKISLKDGINNQYNFLLKNKKCE